MFTQNRTPPRSTEPNIQIGKLLNRMRQLGFTLIELMVVISIIIILISVAVVSYRTSVLHAKETVLHQDLDAMRNAIDAYTYDKKKAPQALDDLVTANYLKAIPKDPFTGQPNWEVHQEDNPTDPNQVGIDDVHSASDTMSSEGTPYNSW
jgi:general secretion pathway protein G